MPTIDEFNSYVQRLANHDWTYDYSDDHSVWRRGQQVRDGLIADARKHPEFQQAFNAWSNYIFPKKEDYSAEGWASRKLECLDTIEAIRRYISNEARNRMVILAD